MIFRPRIYAPFDSFGQRIVLAENERIAYYARSFSWITQTELEPRQQRTLEFLTEHQGRVQEILQQSVEAAKQADCERARMGCVITSMRLEERGSGCNAKPEGITGSCRDIGCIPAVTCRLTIHAEQDALRYVDTRYDVVGHVLHNTAVPCLDCMKICKARNVKVVVYQQERDQPEYDRPIMSSITLNSGILFVKMDAE